MFAVDRELQPGDPTSVALGRRLVTDALAAVPGPARCSVDDAVLAVSELVTNAVAVAQDCIRLAIEVTDEGAKVAVYDDGPGQPVALPATPDRAHGRGLSIVGVVASRWGVHADPPGKWVWAEFPVVVVPTAVAR